MLTFRPIPFLTNPHVQTVLAYLFDWPSDLYPSAQHTIALADGDALVIHDAVPPTWQAGDPAALLIHGLGGCHRSSWLRRVGSLLGAHGVRIFRLDLRAAGAGVALARKRYNAAASDDVFAAVKWIQLRHPDSALGLAGFSLGGNLVLKMAGEHPELSLAGIVAVNPPIDLARCSALIQHLPFYDWHYARLVKTQIEAHERHFPDLPAAGLPRKLTLFQLDEMYTAPRGGFASVAEYHRLGSALPVIPEIRTPTLAVTAKDDPFVAYGPIADIRNPHIEVEIVPHGGHLGYIGSDGKGGLRWMQRRIAQWLLDRLHSPR